MLRPLITPSASTTYRAIIQGICLSDTIDVQINVFDLEAGPDIQVCIGETFEIPAGEDFLTATYQWSPPAGLEFSCTACPAPVVTALVPGVYDVPVSLTAEACTFMDVVTITVLDATAPEFSLADDATICEGETYTLGNTDTPGNAYTWTANPATTIDPVASPVVQPAETTTYYVSVLNGVCPVPSLDSVTVTVVPLPIPAIQASQLQLCQGDTISLFTTVVESDVTYSWTGTNGIIHPDSSFTLISPSIGGTFTLTADRQGCEVTEAIDIEVTRIAIDLNQPDTVFICLGESLQVNASVVPFDVEVVWNPASVQGTAPLLIPPTYTEYLATVTVGVCVRQDSFIVQVDSLPANMPIMAMPDDMPYCAGELVQLVSPVYEPSLYPNIEHLWVGPGMETSDTLYNLVLTTVDTFTYVRTTVNGGCVQEDTILLNVISPEALAITPQNPALCPGGTVQLSLANPPAGATLEWTPGDGLSCTDCPNPIATPSSTTTYSVEADIEGCTISQSVTVQVLVSPVIDAIPNRVICAGELVSLNAGSQQEGTNYTWTAPGFNSNEVNPVVGPQRQRRPTP
ncbi:MAG: hypothetical protein R2795_25750 [Saprospiraceae bacterium]